MNAAKNGGVSTTTTRSIGCRRNHSRREGTTVSITTVSARKTSQVAQLRTFAIASHGSPKSEPWMTRIGITSTAATMTGISNRRSSLSLRASMREGFDAGGPAPTNGRSYLQ